MNLNPPKGSKERPLKTGRMADKKNRLSFPFSLHTTWAFWVRGVAATNVEYLGVGGQEALETKQRKKKMGMFVFGSWGSAIKPCIGINVVRTKMCDFFVFNVSREAMWQQWKQKRQQKWFPLRIWRSLFGIFAAEAASDLLLAWGCLSVWTEPLAWGSHNEKTLFQTRVWCRTKKNSPKLECNEIAVWSLPRAADGAECLHFVLWFCFQCPGVSKFAMIGLLLFTQNTRWRRHCELLGDGRTIKHVTSVFDAKYIGIRLCTASCFAQWLQSNSLGTLARSS